MRQIYKGDNGAKYLGYVQINQPTKIIRSLTTAVAASGLPLERGGSSVVGRGRSGHEDARNMLSCI